MDRSCFSLLSLRWAATIADVLPVEVRRAAASREGESMRLLAVGEDGEDGHVAGAHADETVTVQVVSTLNAKAFCGAIHSSAGRFVGVSWLEALLKL